jgi:hypothetical protein
MLRSLSNGESRRAEISDNINHHAQRIPINEPPPRKVYVTSKQIVQLQILSSHLPHIFSILFPERKMEPAPFAADGLISRIPTTRSFVFGGYSIAILPGVGTVLK